MHSPQFLKTLNLRHTAEYAEKVGQPLVLSASDREIFPPRDFPLPTLNRVPEGWACVDSVVDASWEGLTYLFEKYPESGFAILGKGFYADAGFKTYVGRFVHC